jgi:tetratricopeptide (TPR) repeat protein
VSRRRTGPVLGLALMLTLAASVGRAQVPAMAPDSPAAKPNDQEQMRNLDDEARERFELGRTFLEAGRFQQAAEEFEEAYRLSGRAQLLYNVYIANRDAGNWEAASNALRIYLDKVPDAPDQINLRARLASMEAQAEAQREQARQAAADRERADRLAATRKEVVRSKLPWVLIGTGGALLATSLITGIMAKTKADDLDGSPLCIDGGTRCASAKKGDVESLRSLAVATDVLWITGGVVAVTGVVLRLSGVLDKERQVPVAASFDGHGARLAYTVRY